MILYARGIEGEILRWFITVSENADGTTILSSSGQLGGTITQFESPIIKGTNIGKRNATTSYQQANKEMLSQIERKRKKGYKSLEDLGLSESIRIQCTNNIHRLTDILEHALPKYNTDASNAIKPMKCQPFRPNYFTYPCIGQPKINGVRGVVMWVVKQDGLFKEEGSVIKTKEGLEYRIKQITDWFDNNIFNDISNRALVFDGEVYCAGEPVTSIGGAARNINNPIHSRLQFICFDLSIEDVPQLERTNMLDTLFIQFDEVSQLVPGYHFKITHLPVVYLCHRDIYNDRDAQEYAKACIGLGYEGCVIRDMTSEYKFGQRPTTMMKIKQYTVEEFKIVDILPFNDDTEDENSKVGQGCKFLLVNNNGTDETFTCNPIGNYEKRMQYLKDKDKYVFRKCLVKFYERTINNLPFHANVIRIL